MGEPAIATSRSVIKTSVTPPAFFGRSAAALWQTSLLTLMEKRTQEGERGVSPQLSQVNTPRLSLRGE